MMDVVYPLINKSKLRDDFEFRMSLRSLEIQPWIRSVFVVGHCPKWFKGGYHIECPDPYTMNKDANIINKILRACNAHGISDQFIVNSDDQFFLEAMTEEELETPPFDAAPVRNNYMMKSATANWSQRVLSTINWCKKNGYPDWSFDAHRPYMVDRRLYPCLMSQVAWGFNNGVTTHIYFNLKGDAPKVNSGTCVRIKQGQNYEMIKSTISKEKRATFLNVNDAGMNPAMKRYLTDRFPQPSRWEE